MLDGMHTICEHDEWLSKQRQISRSINDTIYQMAWILTMNTKTNSIFPHYSKIHLDDGLKLLLFYWKDVCIILCAKIPN